MSFMFCRGRGLEGTQQTSWFAFLPSQVSHNEKCEYVLVDIFTFLVQCGFWGTSWSAKGRWWGEAAVRVVTLCRSLCSPAQRASSRLTAALLMSCRAREAVSHTSWSFWYATITFMDLPSTHIKMKFPLTSEHRSQKEVKVFMFIFPFGCYFGSPLLPVLIEHCKHFRKLICRSTAHKRSTCQRTRLCLLQKSFWDSDSWKDYTLPQEIKFDVI